ncbi:MAG: protein-tyrosine-phosphatase [Acidimicrobiia bacterium]
MLVVCTGNICRSPMGEALLRAHLDARGTAVNVHSAGTMAWNAGPPNEAVAAMAEMGLDISAHRSRQLTTELIGEADLVLGMTRQHVDRITALAPDAATRVFLVEELVRLGGVVGARSEGEALRAWLLRVHEARPHAQVRGRGEDEVGDPIGEPLDVYRATAARLDASLRDLASLLTT